MLLRYYLFDTSSLQSNEKILRKLSKILHARLVLYCLKSNYYILKMCCSTSFCLSKFFYPGLRSVFNEEEAHNFGKNAKIVNWWFHTSLFLFPLRESSPNKTRNAEEVFTELIAVERALVSPVAFLIYALISPLHVEGEKIGLVACKFFESTSKVPSVIEVNSLLI